MEGGRRKELDSEFILLVLINIFTIFFKYQQKQNRSKSSVNLFVYVQGEVSNNLYWRKRLGITKRKIRLTITKICKRKYLKIVYVNFQKIGAKIFIITGVEFSKIKL